MMPVAYLLEDDLDISKLIVRALSQHGFSVLSFTRQSDFEREVTRQLPDICLIDLSLPDGDGLSLIKSPILPATMPKIIVTGRGNLTDRIVGLEIGADDYIVKPFEPRELVARVRAVLRRSSASKNAQGDTNIARFGNWTANFSACTLSNKDGHSIDLSSAEASLLLAFVNSAGRVLTRSQLLDATSGRSTEPFDRSMDARISRLRKKLGDDPKSPDIIRTVYGVGYVFGTTVEWL
ncbi:response regulator transcription factor [Sulfitobacter sp. F26204]|uniref:winged helix-turn-helix domain-containing protein n=1 Tax=Sulfitobacter sp. F26204 TaxID=2996014 RepID=UPI00225E3D8C|nr:response regulator transcription factor [Sulfitobacter sp. F26204]MCX7561767.1 response regulator transcription factor [Sulfitobacter sp. F26204]